MSHLVNFIPGNFNIQDINATYINQMCFLCQIPVLLAWLDEWLCVTGRRKEGGVFYDVEDRRHKYYLCLIKTQLQNQLNWFVFWCAYTSIWKTQQPGRAYTGGKNAEYAVLVLMVRAPLLSVCSRVCVFVKEREGERKAFSHWTPFCSVKTLAKRVYDYVWEQSWKKRSSVWGE